MLEKRFYLRQKRLSWKKLLMSEIVCKEFQCVRQKHKFLSKKLSIYVSTTPILIIMRSVISEVY